MKNTPATVWVVCFEMFGELDAIEGIYATKKAAFQAATALTAACQTYAAYAATVAYTVTEYQLLS